MLGSFTGSSLINGLGFTSKPLSLTPKFFEGKPLDILFRENIKASHFNRSKELIDKFNSSNVPRYLIADSKLYTKKNAENLSMLNFITRIPHSNKKEKEFISKAFSFNKWIALNRENKYYAEDVTHNEIKQRWIVVYSKSANNRARKRIMKKVQEEENLLKEINKKLAKDAFACVIDAEKFINEYTKSIKYHITNNSIVEIIKDKKFNKPTYIANIAASKNEVAINTSIFEQSCYTLATNISKNELTEIEVINAYKNQNSSIENMGFRFLKDPIFFTSSLFLKKESR
ncbi:MAG: IS1634 family transposase [archaeon]|nr:IS1634 family transposase [archaeon]